MFHQIQEVRQHKDQFEQEVEGLIEMCKFLAGRSKEEKAAVKFMNINPHVVVEAKRRILKKS